MKFIKLRSSKSPEELLSAISDNDFVSEGVVFNEKGTKPYMHVKKKKNGKIKIKCEVMGGPTKDNGFLEGTYFKGKIVECDGGSRIKGIILTAPIFHVALAILTIAILIQCLYLKAINIIPVFAILFDIIMFKGEFKKQTYIERYLKRAIVRLEKKGKRIIR